MTTKAEATAAFVERRQGSYLRLVVCPDVGGHEPRFQGIEVLVIKEDDGSIFWVGWVKHWHRATASRMARQKARAAGGRWPFYGEVEAADTADETCKVCGKLGPRRIGGTCSRECEKKG